MDNLIAQCYRILELKPGASIVMIEKAFKDLTKVWDSDRLNDEPELMQEAWEKIKEITWAHETLTKHIPALLAVLPASPSVNEGGGARLRNRLIIVAYLLKPLFRVVGSGGACFLWARSLMPHFTALR